jgi:hypothetical protein
MALEISEFFFFSIFVISNIWQFFNMSGLNNKVVRTRVFKEE